MWSRWPGGAIRQGPLKLIQFFEDDRVELYNLAEDIGESRNLAPPMLLPLSVWRSLIVST